MGLGGYFSEKAEKVMMLGAAGFVKSNPAANLEIGSILNQALSSLIQTDGYRAQEIFESLNVEVELARMFGASADESRATFVRAADIHRRAGQKSEMYAASILAAFYRRASLAAKGRLTDIARFEEMAIAIANCITVYRLAQIHRDERPLS